MTQQILMMLFINPVDNTLSDYKRLLEIYDSTPTWEPYINRDTLVKRIEDMSALQTSRS